MLTTVEGVYRDGKVELDETPRDGYERRVLVTFLDNGNGVLPVSAPQGSFIRRGMFPQLLALTDEDFKGAEFHIDEEEYRGGQAGEASR